MAIGYRPAPVLARAQLAPGSVTLPWVLTAASPMVDGYRVEAGTGPGLADLGAFDFGPAETATFIGVPPGRY